MSFSKGSGGFAWPFCVVLVSAGTSGFAVVSEIAVSGVGVDILFVLEKIWNCFVMHQPPQGHNGLYQHKYIERLQQKLRRSKNYG